MASEANRLSVPPEIRREIEAQITTLEGLSLSGDASTLRDAVVDALRAAFGAVNP